MSKGDNRRPRQVDYETFAKNWEAVFGKKKPRKKQKRNKKGRLAQLARALP